MIWEVADRTAIEDVKMSPRFITYQNNWKWLKNTIGVNYRSSDVYVYAAGFIN
jgi:hypothetical protein